MWRSNVFDEPWATLVNIEGRLLSFQNQKFLYDIFWEVVHEIISMNQQANLSVRILV